MNQVYQIPCSIVHDDFSVLQSVDVNMSCFRPLNVFSHHKSILCRRDVHAGQDVAGAEAKHRDTSQTSSAHVVVSTPPRSKSKSLKLPPIITSSSQVSTEIEPQCHDKYIIISLIAGNM